MPGNSLMRVLWTRKSPALWCWIALVLCPVWFSPAQGAVTGGPSAKGSVLVGEYKLPASLDATVSSELETELWAAVYRPTTPGPYPLLVFLHGNHGTCGYYESGRGARLDYGIDYTYSGTCPEGWVPTPNHLGYAYLARELAGKGYVVVSINANRGVTAAYGVEGDGGLNLRRGRLVLRHLQQLVALDHQLRQAVFFLI
jgi:hypothetical protein